MIDGIRILTPPSQSGYLLGEINPPDLLFLLFLISMRE